MSAFQLQVKNYLFSPNLIPSLTTLILLPFLVSLGFWQLDRADQKREIDKGIHEAIAKPALQLNTIDTSKLSTEIYRTVSIKGKYDTEHQFLLDNRTHLGKPGYHVLTPFLFDNNNGKQAVLINRGWITYRGTRDNIPSITLGNNEREILGTLKEIGDSIVLNDEVETQSNPKLIQSIQLTELMQDLDYKLLAAIIELSKEDKDGFVREWQPYYGSIDKHNAYALQWFSMAAILLFLFIRLNTKKV